MTTGSIFVAVAALAIVSYLAGRSGQIRTNAQADAKLREGIKQLGKAIAEGIEAK